MTPPAGRRVCRDAALPGQKCSWPYSDCAHREAIARAAVARLHDLEDRWRLVRVSTDLLSVFGTRTETGDRITAEWGEPDADGIYDPIFRTTPADAG